MSSLVHELAYGSGLVAELGYASGFTKVYSEKGKGSCATAEELAAWLDGCDLDTSTWGETKEKTKTVADLWAELQSGETTLVVGSDGRVQRRLRVVKVVVRPKEVPSAHLENSVQRFPDGRERVRNLLLSEKVPCRVSAATSPPPQRPFSASSARFQANAPSAIDAGRRRPV